MKKITIPFNNCKSDIPLISFSLNDEGERYDAIVDSGSELTLFDYTFVQEHEDYFTDVQNNNEFNVVGISDNKKIQVSEKCVDIIVNDTDSITHTVPILGLATDLSELSKRFSNSYGDEYKLSLIIGSNELRKFGAKINFVNETLSLKYEPAQ